MGAGAAIAAATTVASTGYTINRQREARKDQKKARREQQRASELEHRKAAIQNARERQRSVAERNAALSQQRARAAALEGSTTGTGQATGALQSQTAGNISFQQSLQNISGRQAAHQQRATSSMGSYYGNIARANLPGQLGVSGGSILSNFGAVSDTFQTGVDKFTGMFNKG